MNTRILYIARKLEHIGGRLQYLDDRIVLIVPNYHEVFDVVPGVLDDTYKVLALEVPDDLVQTQNGQTFLWLGPKDSRNAKGEYLTLPVASLRPLVGVENAVPGKHDPIASLAAFGSFPDVVKLSAVLHASPPELLVALPGVGEVNAGRCKEWAAAQLKAYQNGTYGGKCPECGAQADRAEPGDAGRSGCPNGHWYAR